MKSKQKKYDRIEGMPDELFAYDRNFGCQLFQVQIPKKALIKLKAKYRNVGAAIRGMIQQDLGPDWPNEEVVISESADHEKRKILLVIPPEPSKLKEKAS